MILKMQGSTKFEEFVGAVANLHEAESEQDIFLAFHAACESVAGPLALCGYVVARNGKTVREVAQVGDLNLPAGTALPNTDWLIEGVEFPISQAANGSPILAQPLVSGARVVGGVILAGSGLVSPESRLRCSRLTRFCAGAIVAFHERRLSQMVLEALEESEEAISFYDANDGIVFTNNAYHRVFPHYPEPSQLLGRNHLDLYRMDLDAGIIDDPLARNDPEAYLAKRKQMAEVLVARQREIQKISSKTYIYTRSRSNTGATMSRRIDISEQASTEARLRERERELHILAFQDPLTGLFNRAYLLNLIGDLQNRMREGSLKQMAVFLVDLNGFKFVNDTYGHDCGDFVLKVVAQRLSKIVWEGDAVVRLGGDEFVIIFERALVPAELAATADAIIAELAQPVEYGDVVLTTGTSVGIAVRAGKDADLGTVIADADLAMYEVKKMKCSAHMFFDPGMRTGMLERLNLLEDLRNALREGEFELYYQPQFSTAMPHLVGFEALVRWHHPTRGLVSPGVFIPLMEEYGLIEALGEWVLRTACTEAARWPGELHVAVNVSPLQVRNGRFSLILSDTLLRTGLAPHRLELEITESVFIDDEAGTRAQLELWKSLGVRIALDDFGSGYSSLGYLNAFPIDKIKIDRGFLGKLNPDNPDEAADIILRTIIDLGRALDMTVTAEGVERADQLEFLSERRCSEVQGYLLGRPMPVEQARLLFGANDRSSETDSQCIELA
jgi:diguanylate cyclase (GGDEF)-like protein